MPRLSRLAQRLRADPRGATTVEYGMILAFVVLAIIAAVTSVADATTGMWGHIETSVDTATKAEPKP